MTRTCHGIAPLVVAGLVAAFCVPAQAAVGDFVAQGRLLFDSRLRYENVDQGGYSSSANAATLRERLGFETADLDGFKLLAELQTTQHLSSVFNDTINGRTAYPQVPDPESFALNRLQASYGVAGLSATLGRQVINLDDQRFIGASAFRQNEQTFDALRLDYAGIPGLTATYAYLDRVNRVFGNRSPAGHFNADIHLVNAGYDAKDLGRIGGYTYLLDLHGSPTLSTATYGLQWSGTLPLGEDLKGRYLLGYANQQPYGGNLRDFSLNYWRIEAGLDSGPWSVAAGSETLGGNGVVGFSTPLATLHAFQGDADVFLTTPAEGVADRYAKASYQIPFDTGAPARTAILSVAYHHYWGAKGAADFGQETDLGAGLKLSDHWRIDLNYASYDGHGGFAGRDKTWLALTTTY